MPAELDSLTPVCRPAFLGIGAHRAASTWLAESLRAHPRIWTPGSKELHYFDYHIERRPRLLRALGAGRLLEHHLRYGIRFLPANLAGKLTGEITPAYCTLSVVQVRRLKALLPEVKIVFLLRDPIERAWSHAKKDFASQYGTPLQGANDDEIEEFFRQPFVKSRSDYEHALSTWLSVFPEEQVHVAYAEVVTSKPQEGLGRIFEFLGVDPDPCLDWERLGRPIHSSKAVPIPKRWRTRLGATLRDQFEAVRMRLDDSPPWPEEPYLVEEDEVR